MTSTYLPSSPAPATYDFKSNYRTQTSMAVSGKILSRKYGGQFYELTLAYPPMRRDQAAPIIAFLEEQEGRFGIFRVRLPDDMAGVTGVEVGNFANLDDDPNKKLYRITALGVPPTLRPMPLTAGNVVTSGVEMRCSLKNDVQMITLGNKGLVSLRINLIERV